MKNKMLVAIMAMIIIVLTACAAEAQDDSEAKAPEAPFSDAETMHVAASGVALPSGAFPDREHTVLKNPERYYPAPVSEIIPSTDYGQIWPYIGGYAEAMMGEQHELIGICDEFGKIICDPVFKEAALIGKDDKQLYAFVKYDIYNGKKYEYVYPTTLAALDGSWAETFEHALWEETSGNEFSPPVIGGPGYDYSHSYSWRDAVRYDYITAKRGGRWGVVDWDGSVLLPFEYIEPVCFYEGLASVLSEDGGTLSFIDITGKTVLGPFEAPSRPRDEWGRLDDDLPITDKMMFHEGYAKFYENGKYGIIDRDGRTIIPAVHGFITCMDGGMAMFINYSYEKAGEPPSQSFGIVNDAGVVILDPAGHAQHSAPRNAGGYAVIAASGEVWERVYYDGTRTPHEGRGFYINNEGYYAFTRVDKTLPADSYYIDYVNDSLIIVFDRNKDTWRLYDYELNPMSPDNPGSAGWSMYGGAMTDYILISTPVPGGWSSRPSYMIYGLDGRLLLNNAYLTIMPIGDKFMVRGRNTAGLVDKDGKYIIEVSVTMYNID